MLKIWVFAAIYFLPVGGINFPPVTFSFSSQELCQKSVDNLKEMSASVEERTGAKLLYADCIEVEIEYEDPELMDGIIRK